MGHGGLYKLGEAGQRLTAAALRAPSPSWKPRAKAAPGAPVCWRLIMSCKEPGESLSDYLDRRVFREMTGARMLPDTGDMQGFDAYMARFKAILEVERAAVAHL